MKTQYFLMLVLFLFFGCKTKTVLPISTDDKKIEVVFFQLNDVYEIAALDGGKIGGMARVATAIKELKKENPNTFCVLAGDFLSPSLMGKLKNEGKRISGEQMIETMNACGIDLVTFGNHEFDLKMSELQERMNESTFVWLGTSVRQIIDKEFFRFHKMNNGVKIESPDTYIWTVKDSDGTEAKVGLFGTTIDSNPKSFVHYQDYYERPIEESQKLVGQVDVQVGITHLEVAQDRELAQKMPTYVPLFIGGHDHDNMLEKQANTVIAKADANAKSAYIHRLVIDKSSGEVRVDLQSELLILDEKIEEDSTVKVLVDKWLKIQDKTVSQIYPKPYELIYTTIDPLDARESSIRNFQTNFGQIMTKAMTAASRNEVIGSFTNGGSTRIDDQLKGKIYAIDIFRSLPYGGGIVEVQMRGSLLIKMLNGGRNNKGKGGYLQLDNFRFDEKESSWFSQGEKLKETAEYWVAVTDFLLTGNESQMDFFTEENPDILAIDKPVDSTDLRSDIRACIIEYMKKMK